MKRLGLAVVAYNQDYDEKFPFNCATPGGGTIAGATCANNKGWAGELYSYIKSGGVYKCPDDSTTAIAPAVPISYVWNKYLCQLNISALNALLPTNPETQNGRETGTTSLTSSTGAPQMLTLAISNRTLAAS